MIIQDIKGIINKTANFLLGRNLSDEDTDKLANHLDIKNFRNNHAVNFEPLREAGMLVDGEESFIRKGLKKCISLPLYIIVLKYLV